jgi:hypothetical protein
MMLRRFTHCTRKDEERAGEIESHLVLEQDANAARGLPPQEHAARLNCAFEFLAQSESACGAIGLSLGSTR